MIPKIIHYTWFSGEEMPQDIKKCVASWSKVMPEYKLRLWDMDSIKDINSDFLREALQMRKWAYAADFVRLYALFHEGGIYLDTDVMVFKPFDEFINYDAFIGKEESMHFNNDGYMGRQYLTSHCMGAVKGHLFIKQCLDYYENRHYVLSTNKELPTLLRYHYVIIPYIQAVIAKGYGYDWDPRNQKIQDCREGLRVYPSDYFCGNYYLKNSYCQHLALGSWREAHGMAYNKRNIKNKVRFWILRITKKLLLRFSIALVKIDKF